MGETQPAIAAGGVSSWAFFRFAIAGLLVSNRLICGSKKGTKGK
jgi:hypothetical protein